MMRGDLCCRLSLSCRTDAEPVEGEAFTLFFAALSHRLAQLA